MSRKLYNWSNPEQHPILQVHSAAKHEMIEAYLEQYIKMLSSASKRKKIKLTIVDGFSGGGIYHRADTNKSCHGSPLILLKVIKRVQTMITKEIDTFYYFIDRDSSALSSLEFQLKKNGYGKLIGERIFLLNGSFSELFPSLKEIVGSRKSYILFLLDQYGYKDVPLSLVKQISRCFPQAEILLTFAIDAMLNYISSGSQFRSYTRKLDPKGNLLSNEDISTIKNYKKSKSIKGISEWRMVAQRKVIRQVKRMSGTKHCTPYFIVSRKSSWSYWLMHMTNNAKSRNMMLRLHCKQHNSLIVNKGHTMFGFDPRNQLVRKGKDSPDKNLVSQLKFSKNRWYNP